MTGYPGRVLVTGGSVVAAVVGGSAVVGMPEMATMLSPSSGAEAHLQPHGQPLEAIDALTLGGVALLYAALTLVSLIESREIPEVKIRRGHLPR